MLSSWNNELVVLIRGEGINKNLRSKKKGYYRGNLALDRFTPNEEILNSPKKLTAWNGASTVPKYAISISSLKMKYLSIVIVFLILLGSNSLAQGKEKDLDPTPNFYSTAAIGGIEFFSISVGKYFNDDLAVDVKWSMFGVGASGPGPNGAASIGFGINYFFKKLLIFEYIGADYLNMYRKGYKGYGFTVIIGNCTNMKTGFGFVYELGMGYSNVIAEYSSPQYERLILLGPVIKIGLNYNL